MICEERLLTILIAPHLSEKASSVIKKNNTFVLKVSRDAKKIEIKEAVKKLFKVKVKNVNTLLIKGKRKRHNQRISRRRNWKKAYITLNKGQKLDLISNSE
ncbi:50S ribosomal protein L23 [Candidatus Ecksteinia adelgidicola]|nr:50S ribosomal protein L23 [Candidatus Ecksteinia adelgidicola]